MICLSQAKLSGKSHHFVDVVHEYALHSRSQRCVPFGQHQELRPLGRSNFRTMRKVIVSHSQPIRFVRLYTEYTQSDRKSWNRGVGHSQRSRFLVLTETNVASGKENAPERDAKIVRIRDAQCNSQVAVTFSTPELFSFAHDGQKQTERSRMRRILGRECWLGLIWIKLELHKTPKRYHLKRNRSNYQPLFKKGSRAHL